MVTTPRFSPQTAACTQWLQSLADCGERIIVPEIADYEVRRELLRAKKTRGLAKLDQMAILFEYLPITTAAMRQAASFWAQARQQGLPTAADVALDADVILAAQSATLGVPHAVIATTNVGHLSRLVAAETWTKITAS
jgi:predicted nucleic acid-binding protein